jgi:hypothetical protein
MLLDDFKGGTTESEGARSSTCDSSNGAVPYSSGRVFESAHDRQPLTLYCYQDPKDSDRLHLQAHSVMECCKVKHALLLGGCTVSPDADLVEG